LEISHVEALLGGHDRGDTLALAVQAAIRKQIDVEADDSVNTTDGGLS
jgi:hypothetical protein